MDTRWLQQNSLLNPENPSGFSFYLSNRILRNFPRLTVLGDDGVAAEVVMDALSEESFSHGLAMGSEDNLRSFFFKSRLSKLHQLVAVSMS